MARTIGPGGVCPDGLRGYTSTNGGRRRPKRWPARSRPPPPRQPGSVLSQPLGADEGDGRPDRPARRPARTAPRRPGGRAAWGMAGPVTARVAPPQAVAGHRALAVAGTIPRRRI